MIFLCHAIRFECYAMVYVVKDKDSATKSACNLTTEYVHFHLLICCYGLMKVVRLLWYYNCADW